MDEPVESPPFLLLIFQNRLSSLLPPGTEVRVALEIAPLDQAAAFMSGMDRRHMMGGGRMTGPWAYVHGVHALETVVEDARDAGWIATGAALVQS
jgi:hypothetical protein